MCWIKYKLGIELILKSTSLKLKVSVSQTVSLQKCLNMGHRLEEDNM